MIILGIDPGLATVGIGIISCGNASSTPVLSRDEVLSMTQQRQIIDFCTIETPAALPTPERLKEIADDLRSIIKKHKPELAVVEKLYFEKNQKTAMAVAEARGVIILTVQEAGIPILEPTPLELKSAITGDGRADKEQMKDMLQITLKTDLSGVADDAVDALGLALYGESVKNN